MLQIILICVLLMPPMAVAADTFDPHAVYEKKCAHCHEDHARTFALEHLKFENDHLVGVKRKRDLQQFLENGHGRLDPVSIQPMIRHLKAIVKAGGLYNDKCRMCHEPAVDLARTKLVMEQGVLMGRYTGRHVGYFMKTHGRLSEAEHSIIVDALRRQLDGRQPPD